MTTHSPATPDTLEKSVIYILEQSSKALTKNQIAKALAVKGEQRVELKQVLKKLKQEGYASKLTRKKVIAEAKPVSSSVEAKSSNSRLAERPSSRLKSRRFAPIDSDAEFPDTKHRLGLLSTGKGRGWLTPCHRKDFFRPLEVDLNELPSLSKEGMREEMIVSFHLQPRQEAFGDKQPKIDRVLGAIHNPKTYSLMAIHNHDLPHVFSDQAIQIARAGQVPSLGNRTDLRDIPLVTIDGETAQDFDDAVWAAPDSDPHNPQGWKVIVAIADVAYYVPFDSALDQEAEERGNSVYFANCVVPMLPESLSNDLCSLKPNQNRACLAVEMKITAEGKIKSHRFKRGLMRSRARFTYTQVQQAIEGNFDDATGPLWSTVIEPLYGAYRSLLTARHNRGTLDINVPEHIIVFDDKGNITRIDEHKRLESHQLIEEMMIAANVCAAKTLLTQKIPTLFRIHDLPTVSRVENLKIVLKSLKLKFPKAKKFIPSHFGTVLNQVQGSPYQQLINDLVLRSQAQAIYSPQNIGHFGLGLVHYCHFTSPIRRYADLVVHRGLIETLNLGEGGHPYSLATLETLGNHTSSTERKAAIAEREVKERLMTAFLEKHIGEVYPGSITGVTGAGLFIRLENLGAEGFIPKSQLPYDFYLYEAEQYRYLGQRTRRIYQLDKGFKYD